jgi:hypothetical protein
MRICSLMLRHQKRFIDKTNTLYLHSVSQQFLLDQAKRCTADDNRLLNEGQQRVGQGKKRYHKTNQNNTSIFRENKTTKKDLINFIIFYCLSYLHNIYELWQQRSTTHKKAIDVWTCHQGSNVSL